jgi:hypothetical protein
VPVGLVTTTGTVTGPTAFVMVGTVNRSTVGVVATTAAGRPWTVTPAPENPEPVSVIVSPDQAKPGAIVVILVTVGAGGGGGSSDGSRRQGGSVQTAPAGAAAASETDQEEQRHHDGQGAS